MPLGRLLDIIGPVPSVALDKGLFGCHGLILARLAEKDKTGRNFSRRCPKRKGAALLSLCKVAIFLQEGGEGLKQQARQDAVGHRDDEVHGDDARQHQGHHHIVGNAEGVDGQNEVERNHHQGPGQGAQRHAHGHAGQAGLAVIEDAHQQHHSARCHKVHHEAHPAVDAQDKGLHQGSHQQDEQAGDRPIQQGADEHRHVRHIVLDEADGRDDGEMDEHDQHHRDGGQHAHLNQSDDIGADFFHNKTSFPAFRGAKNPITVRLTPPIMGRNIRRRLRTSSFIRTDRTAAEYRRLWNFTKSARH